MGLISFIPTNGFKEIRAVNEKVPPVIGPKKRIDKEYKDFPIFVPGNCRVLKLRFLVFPGVLEGLGRSGRLVGTSSTCPGTY